MCRRSLLVRNRNRCSFFSPSMFHACGLEQSKRPNISTMSSWILVVNSSVLLSPTSPSCFSNNRQTASCLVPHEGRKARPCGRALFCSEIKTLSCSPSKSQPLILCFKNYPIPLRVQMGVKIKGHPYMRAAASSGARYIFLFLLFHRHVPLRIADFRTRRSRHRMFVEKVHGSSYMCWNSFIWHQQFRFQVMDLLKIRI